jgi:DNA-binding transcriptional regulator YiaG
MKPATYRKLRRSVGSQSQVARLLSVHVSTISKRERGALGIDREAEYALRWLAAQQEATP